MVLLVRGGGSSGDLLPFDDVALAKSILRAQQRGVAVVTGIGHHADRTLADLVAGHACGTPTAAGKALASEVWKRRSAVKRADARERERARQEELDEARAAHRRAEEIALRDRQAADAAAGREEALRSQLSDELLDSARLRLESTALIETLLIGLLGLLASWVATRMDGVIVTLMWSVAALALGAMVFVSRGTMRCLRLPTERQRRRGATTFDEWERRARLATTPREIRRLTAGLVSDEMLAAASR